jgi:PAS domain S-box-containing protein
MPKRSWDVLIAACKKDLSEPLAALLREEHQCQVKTVHRRHDILPVLQGSKRYHAVLLDDLVLSDNGEFDLEACAELIKQMKRIRPTTEILLCTGGDPVLSRLALKEGARSCEQNPFDVETLALHVSQAVEFQQRSSEKYILEKLIEINSSLHSGKNEAELLETILNGVHSFGFDRVRLYLLSEDRKFLKPVAGLGMGADFARAPFELKDCYYMNRLLEAGRSLVFNRADGGAVPFEEILDKADVDEWAGVPMFLKGEIIGKLSVDNKFSGLSILEDDLRAIEVCASQAATAIQNRRTAEALRNAAVEVTEQSDRASLLETITRKAMALVGASGCGIYALRPSHDDSPDKLIIIIDSTRPHLKDKELDLGEGVAGRLWESDKSYWIEDDYENWDGKAPVLAGANFGAVLEVKLTWKTRPIGVLYVDRPVGKRFTDEEGSLLSLFAQHAASALVHTERSDNLERLLSSSPIGIMAVDATGLVDRINDAALTMLKRSEDEVMGTYVGPYFRNDGEPRKIGRLLHENGGKLANYRTEIKTSDGTPIPILHSSTFRYDSAGNRAGSIGFFEDLRPLQLLMEASDTVARAENPTLGLQELAIRMASLLPHTFCRILLVDGANQKLTVEAAHFPATDLQSGVRLSAALKRPIVISQWAGLRDMLEGSEHKLFRSSKDQISPFLRRLSEHLELNELVQSLLVVPLKVNDEPVGLFEFGELRSDQPFTEQQTQFAISMAANTAALIRLIRVYEAIQKSNQELTDENQAIRMMSETSSVKDTLVAITSQAKVVFNCISVTIWPYDRLGHRFIPKELVSDGIPQKILGRFRKTEPSRHGITNTVRTRGWLGVQDIHDRNLKFLTPHMRGLLASADIKSFQGVHLRLGDETVGVLYVSYPTAREFDDNDRQSLERFAAYAALALKNARLLEQLRTAKASAQAVARVSALGDLKDTLKSVCREMVRLTGCRVAVLYPYDEIRDRLDSPPKYYGKVDYPDRMLRLTEVPPDSSIRKFLSQKRTVPIENTLARSSPLKKSRFTLDEKILSCVVVPLWVADRKVGVMFVNFRSRRAFTGDEIANIELICRQAAIAVSNAQRFDRLDRQLKGHKVLLQLSESLLEQSSLKEILTQSVASAAKALETDFSNIVLLDDDGNPVFRAGVKWPKEMDGRVLGRDSGSQTGFTIKTRKAVHVYDYALEDKFEVPDVVKEQEISSGLSVPMFDRDEVVGALLVHSLRHRRFSEREEQLLQLMANHTGIAIENTKRLQANERKRSHLRALNEAARAITQSFGADREMVLNKILEQAVACIRQRDGLDTIIGTIQEYHEATKAMIFVGAHPSDQDASLMVDRIKKRRSIDRRVEPKIGVIGRTVETKTAQIVRDVSKDPDFVQFKWKTGSEITAPLMDGNNVLGVINVESNLVGALDSEDLETLKALADLAVIALRNSEQYDQLKQIQGLIGSRTVLEWIREIAFAWSHDIQTTLGEANTRIARLKKWVAPAGRNDLATLQGAVSKLDPEILSHLVHEVTEPIPAGDFIEKYVTYLRIMHSDVSFPDPNPLDPLITIRASRSRLKFAIGNLVNNAVQAMENARTAIRRISFALELLPDLNKLKISISDSGPGMSKNIEDKIRDEKRIEKGPEEKGMGIGLMLVRAMLASYDGDLLLVRTNQNGTEFAITVPYQTLESGQRQ